MLDPEFLDADVMSNSEVMASFDEVLQRLAPTPEVAQIASQQFLCFRQKEGVFGRDITIANAESIPAYAWWARYGYET